VLIYLQDLSTSAFDAQQMKSSVKDFIDTRKSELKLEHNKDHNGSFHESFPHFDSIGVSLVDSELVTRSYYINIVSLIKT